MAGSDVLAFLQAEVYQAASDAIRSFQLPLLVLALFVPSPTAAQATKDGSQSSATLKTVELAGYKFQVPDYFTVHRIPIDSVVQIPIMRFESSTNNRRTWFEVLVKPYEGQIGTSLAEKQFTISGGRTVYYRWTVGDNAYDNCTMNSRCPLPIPAERRYTTL